MTPKQYEAQPGHSPITGELAAKFSPDARWDNFLCAWCDHINHGVTVIDICVSCHKPVGGLSIPKDYDGPPLDPGVGPITLAPTHEIRKSDFLPDRNVSIAPGAGPSPRNGWTNLKSSKPPMRIGSANVELLPGLERKCSKCSHVVLFNQYTFGGLPDWCPVCGAKATEKPRPIEEGTIHCAVCHLKAPMVARPSALRPVATLQPVTDGWMRQFYPWNEERMRSTAKLESSWICPKDAAEVAKFIAHRRVPMRDDEDNL